LSHSMSLASCTFRSRLKCPQWQLQKYIRDHTGSAFCKQIPNSSFCHTLVMNLHIIFSPAKNVSEMLLLMDCEHLLMKSVSELVSVREGSFQLWSNWVLFFCWWAWRCWFCLGL
jgi:hypothetical protein